MIFFVDLRRKIMLKDPSSLTDKHLEERIYEPYKELLMHIIVIVKYFKKLISPHL